MMATRAASSRWSERSRSVSLFQPIISIYLHLDRVVDLSFVRDLVKETYAQRGRPSVEPSW